MATQTQPQPNEAEKYRAQTEALRKANVAVPLYSWYKSRIGERLFCIVGIGTDRKRWVLEKGIDKPFERPLAELQRLINEGNWVPFSYM